LEQAVVTRLRLAVWALFVMVAIVNGAYSAILFSMGMPTPAAMSAVTALLALVAAVVLHLVANAYKAELDHLVALNESLMRMTNAISERRIRGPGPEEDDGL
jgi:hypothetical protein